MGRKSLANERITQILDAFERCIVQYGLEGATLKRIAKEAGVKLSMIHHYIGNRDKLVQAMVTHFIDAYQRDLQAFLDALPMENRLELLIEWYFSEQASDYRPQDTIIVTELMALAEREAYVKALLLDMFKSFEDVFDEEIKRIYPNASAERCRAAAHVLLSLWFGNSTFVWLGFEASYRESAREAVKALLAGLEGLTTNQDASRNTNL